MNVQIIMLKDYCKYSVSSHGDKLQCFIIQHSLYYELCDKKSWQNLNLGFQGYAEPLTEIAQSWLRKKKGFSVKIFYQRY